MKIAVFSESYKPYISGVTRSIETFEKELTLLGHEVFVFAPDYPGYKDNNKKIIRFPSLPTKYPGFRIAIPMPNYIPGISFDVIHSNSIFQLGILAMLYARIKRIPFVYTFHTMFTEYLHNVPVPKSISFPIVSFLIKSFCNRCQQIIVPTAKTKKYLESFGVKAPIEVLPSGIDMSFVEKASSCGIRENLGIPKEAPVLVFVGRLSKEKNIPFLFDMFKIVLGSVGAIHPSAGSGQVKLPVLLIVAGGPMEKEYKQMVLDMGISKNVVFAGQLAYPEVLNYYKAGDIFVFSSKTETQGLVVAEAKACGLTAVALDAQGISECIHDGADGFLLPENKQMFADKILLLLQNHDLRSAMSRTARQNAVNEFSSAILAKKLELIYNSVSSSERGKR